jgi:hypothetical protein
MRCDVMRKMKRGNTWYEVLDTIHTYTYREILIPAVYGQTGWRVCKMDSGSWAACFYVVLSLVSFVAAS